MINTRLLVSHAIHISYRPWVPNDQLDYIHFRYISTQIENGIVNQDRITISYVQMIPLIGHQPQKLLSMNFLLGKILFLKYS